MLNFLRKFNNMKCSREGKLTVYLRSLIIQQIVIELLLSTKYCCRL